MSKHTPAQSDADRDPVAYQRRLNIRMTIRGLVIFYLAFLIFDLVRNYRSGTAEVTLPVVVATCLLFAAAAVAIGVLSYRQWKRGKAKVDRLWDEQARVEDDEDDGADGGQP